MGKICGPYDEGDWLAMKMLRENIIDMRKRDYSKFAIAIGKQETTLKKFFMKEAA